MPRRYHHPESERRPWRERDDADWLTICFVLWVIVIIVLIVVLPLGAYPHRWWWGKSLSACCSTCTPDDDDFVDAVCGSLAQCDEIADIKARLDILEAA